MTGPLLESGTLTQFEPLGTGGETLFGAARELRAAVQRRLGGNVAACFAVPQQNAYADTLDWYAPEPGPVTPWETLSDEQRSVVLEHVEGLRGQVLDLSRQLIHDDRCDRQTFGRLLEHAVTIPDVSHIFLVGDRPVLAFWGFRQRGVDSNTDKPSGTIPPVGRSGRKKPDPGVGPLPPPNPPKPRSSLARWLWWLLAVMLIAMLITAVLWQREVPLWTSTEESQTAPAPVSQTPSVQAPPEPLVFPPDAIETASTNFLTGRWEASSKELIDSDTKRPIALAYDLAQGVGGLTITEQSGTVCRAAVEATFDGDTLTLTPSGEIVCPDRPPFYGVTVTCRPSTDRRAICTGSFPNGKVFQVELGKYQ